MGVRFYCGVSDTNWNRHPVQTGPYACISPIYGRTEATRRENSVRVPGGAEVIQDSGAFSDGPKERLSFEGALKRQIAHAARYDYEQQITHVASYDLLIDEKWADGVRRKRRWSVPEAEAAVEETVAATRYLSRHRHFLPYGPGLVLSAQGVSAEQYLYCCHRVVPFLDSERDIFGLGGWCITGTRPKIMLPAFNETMLSVIPFLASCGVKRVHIWGVIYPKALGGLLWLCDRHGIALSTDSAGPSRRPAFGEWGYAGWRDNGYKRPPVEVRGLHRAAHVALTREWLAHLEETEFYREPEVGPVQLEMLGGEL